jgi:hypothetical protein
VFHKRSCAVFIPASQDSLGSLDEANALRVSERTTLHIRVTLLETPETPARLGASNRFLFPSGAQSSCGRSAPA